MKANELRIDNWVESPIAGEAQINDSGIIWQENRPDHYKPILLTEEWLIKFGFGLHEYPGIGRGKTLYFEVDNIKHSVEVYFPRNVNIDVVVSLDDKMYKHIQYVHQLQNLYFALTGEELTIKELA